MPKYIHKKDLEDDLSKEDGRRIYFSKTPPQNTDTNLKSQLANQNYNHKKSHKLTKIPKEETLTSNSENKKDDRVTTINHMIEKEKQELSNIQTLIKKQSKSLENAKQILRDKQLLLQREFDRKAYKFSGDEKFLIVGELSSKMAHDIRNPLNVIKVQVDLLKLRFSKQEDKIMLDSLSRMERAVGGISNQLTDILNFLRESPPHLENNSILKMIEASLLDIKAPDNVIINLPKDDVTIVCDGYNMQRVFTNMIQNSIQAMDKGGTIIVEVSEQKDNVLINIIDTGVGIPEELLPNIFTPLFTTKKDGTGLGLTICKRIIEQHNGFITVRNNPTTFTISIPKNQQ